MGGGYTHPSASSHGGAVEAGTVVEGKQPGSSEPAGQDLTLNRCWMDSLAQETSCVV